MYIEDRLFSETSDEVLYSVTMTEDEYALYSEFQKEFAARQLIEAIKSGGYDKAADAVAKTIQQSKNVSTRALGHPARQEKIRQAINNRVQAIANATKEI